MSVTRLQHITQIGVEQMGDLADSLEDAEVLRLENLDTDLRPPKSALEFTRQAVDDDEANSYLPFFGLDVMRQTAAKLVGKQAGQDYDWKTECVISAGGLSGILNVLLATLEPGDQVLMTDPVYVGLINRVRLAGGVPVFVPLRPTGEGWRLDREALEKIDPDEPGHANWGGLYAGRMGCVDRFLPGSGLLVDQQHGHGAHPLRRAGGDPPGFVPRNAR
jgi:aspartate/methionine/tyrosine aminotransferase